MPNDTPAVDELLAAAPPMPLGPGAPVAAMRAKLTAACASLPPACAAGLWLRFNFLDESHAISQEDEASPDQNFWHAILHRREPDAWNAKYWWRKVGPHPVLERLREQAPALGHRYTTPADFVDFCEKARDTGTPAEELAQRVQNLEWQLLFDHCRDAAR